MAADGRARFARRGQGPGVGAGVVFPGWRRDSGGVTVRVVGLVVKDQGDRLLTAIGGDGGTEDRMVLFALRYHIIGVRNLWLSRRGDGACAACAVCAGCCWRACRLCCKCSRSGMVFLKERSSLARCVEIRSSKADCFSADISCW